MIIKEQEIYIGKQSTTFFLDNSLRIGHVLVTRETREGERHTHEERPTRLVESTNF